MRGILEADVPLADALRQLAIGLLDHGLAEGREHAAGDPARRVESIRQIRKATKTLRAFLPLVSQATTVEGLAGTLRLLSDAAGLLAPFRDRDAMLKTVDRLLAGREGARVDEARVLLQRIATPTGDPLRDRPLEDLLVSKAVEILTRVRTCVESFRFEQVEPRFVARQLGRDWAHFRRVLRSDWAEGDSEESHEVRKECGRLALQFGFLEERKPKPFGPLRKALRDATAALGDEHDLSMLAENIALEQARLPGGEFVDAALGLCRKAREALRNDGADAVADLADVRSREIRRAALRALGG